MKSGVILLLMLQLLSLDQILVGEARWPPLRWRCVEPVKIGPCRGQVKRYYFDHKRDICRPFIWGGCEPNGNNFATIRRCMFTCRVMPRPMPLGLRPWDYTEDSSEESKEAEKGKKTGIPEGKPKKTVKK